MFHLGRDFLNFIKEKKGIAIAVVFMLLGVVLIFSSSFLDTGSAKQTSDEEKSIDEYRLQLEEELEQFCERIEGVGKCRVFITIERKNGGSYKTSYTEETSPPTVLGITVLCEGAESDIVKRNLVQMLSALFGIGSNRISVLKLNS